MGPLLFAPLEDQLLLARRVTCRVLIIKFSQGPYFENRKAYDEQIEAMRTNAASLEYLEVEGKHHAHLTHPERVAGPISRFLSDSETQ